ncbi:PfkB family carbohydrate kinase [Microbacterium cremeum]|uniref:PfkB family carbohydrate kinase n=1 Tax=Microbacterium cremeum TaxID=2782169 RepID=UPI001886B9B7|nr:PfkB family carbohydrate kinase [Microbacterium cremeum]
MTAPVPAPGDAHAPRGALERAAPAGPRVVVVGEALVDIVHRATGAVDETPGGSPANTALALGRLGRRPTLITRLADDDRGRRVRQWLQASDVEVVAAGAARTATATAHLDATGAASYEFDLDWDLGPEASSLTDRVARTADLVHVGSVAGVLAPGAAQVAALVRAARANAVITYDPNIRPSLSADESRVRAQVETLVGLADIVKASDDDLRWLYPGREVADSARQWLTHGPLLVVVTFGSGGALGVTAGGEVFVPAVATDVADTVGAGDTFMGALIDGFLERNTPGAPVRARGSGIPLADVEALLGRGALAAAVTVSRPGADPPRRDELLALGAA